MNPLISFNYTEDVRTENVNKGESIEMANNRTDLGEILKQQRRMIPMTLRKLAALSGVSVSYLGRIERGERFPSASVLRKVAKPLGFKESELFSLAGYLPSPSTGVEEERAEYIGGRLDPYVSRVLSEEPVEVQRTVIGILNILKSIARALK